MGRGGPPKINEDAISHRNGINRLPSVFDRAVGMAFLGGPVDRFVVIRERVRERVTARAAD